MFFEMLFKGFFVGEIFLTELIIAGDEVVEVIHLPKVVQNVKSTASSIQIDDIVVDEMRDYVRTISNMYHEVSLSFCV